MGSLTDYRRKRNLDRSGEPKARRRASKDGPRFVIQKHAASSLHYDLRPEADGLLRSWAVPRGPSTDPSDRRLAVPTEDHPLENADFEGVIAAGEYGAGTVIVWDTGPYRNLLAEDGRPVPIAEQIEDGHVKVWLGGTKLTGGTASIESAATGTRAGCWSRWMTRARTTAQPGQHPAGIGALGQDEAQSRP